MTTIQMAQRQQRMARVAAERAKKHLYTWCAERNKYVIEAPLCHGGHVIAVLEASRNDTDVHHHAHAMCLALDRASKVLNTEVAA